MKTLPTLITACALALFAANAPAASQKGGDAAAPADASAKPTQQNKMKTCNAEAKGKKGDERKAFMKECLSR